MHSPPRKLREIKSQALVDRRSGRCQSNGDAFGGNIDRPILKLRLGHKSMPLGQCGRASVLVNVTGDEMAFLIEMVVDLSVN